MNISYLKASKVAGINQHVFDEFNKPAQKKKGGPQLPGQMCQQAQWMWGQLVAWSLSTSIPVVKEHYFHPVRKWRFDFFIPSLSIACEYEGIFSKISRHTTHSGYCGDVEKYREAAKMGISVFRYTSKDYRNIINDLNKFIDDQD